MNLNLHQTETIIANALAGLLFVALTPSLLRAIIEIGAPDGRGDAVLIGFYLGLIALGATCLLLAYHGYTER